eukprot:2774905-Rhodomonas_salina.1
MLCALAAFCREALGDAASRRTWRRCRGGGSTRQAACHSHAGSTIRTPTSTHPTHALSNLRS